MDSSLKSSRTAAAAPARPCVVDVPRRAFHWLFALCFAGAWLTAESEHWRALHVALGYTMAGALGLRLVYGIVGPRPARLSVLWRRLSGLPAWCREALRGRVAWTQGQNLVMAAAIALLLVGLVPLALSGHAAYEEWGGEWLEEAHEFFANLLLAVVMLHLSMLALLSVLRRRNLALPMFTGRASAASGRGMPDGDPSSHGAGGEFFVPLSPLARQRTWPRPAHLRFRANRPHRRT